MLKPSSKLGVPKNQQMLSFFREQGGNNHGSRLSRLPRIQKCQFPMSPGTVHGISFHIHKNPETFRLSQFSLHKNFPGMTPMRDLYRQINN